MRANANAVHIDLQRAEYRLGARLDSLESESAGKIACPTEQHSRNQAPHGFERSTCPMGRVLAISSPCSDPSVSSPIPPRVVILGPGSALSRRLCVSAVKTRAPGSNILRPRPPRRRLRCGSRAALASCPSARLRQFRWNSSSALVAILRGAGHASPRRCDPSHRSGIPSRGCYGRSAARRGRRRSSAAGWRCDCLRCAPRRTCPGPRRPR